MSVPAKRKSSSSAKRGRAHKKLKTTKLIKCSKCGKPTLPHQVCLFCGNYQGRQVVSPKTKKKKETKK